jgi:hypothetical protein
VSPGTLDCIPLSDNPYEIVRAHLADPDCRWSVGTYGAIGEFEYEAGEAGLTIDLERLSVSTSRGSLAIVDLAGVRVFAVLDVDKRTREIAFCSTREGARRGVITAVDDLTYDLGLAAPHIDMLVRVKPDDAAAAQALRDARGMSLFAPGHRAGEMIGRSSPTRILVSAVARLEVHQAIPAPGGRSPDGPHTHLLPKYLKEGLMRAPNSPLPNGLFCGLSLYPGPHISSRARSE